MEPRSGKIPTTTTTSARRTDLAVERFVGVMSQGIGDSSAVLVLGPLGRPLPT